MFTGVLRSNSVEKLRLILKDRYGLGLELKTISDISDVNLASQSPFMKNGDLCIPIIGRGKFLATAIVPKAQSVLKNDVFAVSEMVQMVLEPALYSQFLDNQSVDLNSSAENVYPFRKIPSDEPYQTAPSFISTLIYLESSNPQAASRVAFQLHEIGSRWAFLHYQDVKESLNSVQSLRELGPLTLYIENLKDLNSEEQELIYQFSLDSNTHTEPLILIGSEIPVFELLNQGHLSHDLAIHLMQNKIDIHRLPTDFKLLNETLKLFLDRKAFLN